MSGFQKRKEDFICDTCGTKVAGTGYTNHCPKCLWSKHVDVDPGDRLADCGGMMEPVAIEGTVARYRIRHICKKCRSVRMVDVSPNDDQGAVVAIARKNADAA